MLKLLSTILCICISLGLYAQSSTDSKLSIFPTLSPSQNTTLSIPLRGYDLNKIVALKDELMGYQEKVINVEIDEQTLLMRISYNGNMLSEDLIKAFARQGIPHTYQKNVEILSETSEK